jgi:hypothetical protein
VFTEEIRRDRGLLDKRKMHGQDRNAALTQGGNVSNTLKSACWTLVFGALLLLGILGKLDLLVILLPLSLALAFVIAASGRRHNRLTPGIKKG